MAEKETSTNQIGLTRTDYRGEKSTLCPGCGHNTISAQIIMACYEMNIPPSGSLNSVGLAAQARARPTS